MNKRSIGLIFLFFFFMFMCLGCSKAFAAFVTEEQALLIARNWLAFSEGPLLEGLDAEVREIKHYLGEDYGNPGYYLVFLAPRGWVLIAADDRLEAVRAFGKDFLTAEEYERSPARFLFTLFLSEESSSISVRSKNLTQSATSSPLKERWNKLLTPVIKQTGFVTKSQNCEEALANRPDQHPKGTGGKS